MSDYPMLISNKLHSFRNFVVQMCALPYKRLWYNGIFFVKEMFVL